MVMENGNMLVGASSGYQYLEQVTAYGCRAEYSGMRQFIINSVSSGIVLFQKFIVAILSTISVVFQSDVDFHQV